MNQPEVLAITVSGDAGDAFRAFYRIDNARQAAEAVSNVDSLFAAGGHPWAERGLNAVDRDTFQWAAEAVQGRFENGQYREGELAASTPTAEGDALWGSSGHIANESSWHAVCTAPDYCQVGNSIVPFDSYAVIDRSALASPNVRAQGVPVYRVGDLHQGVLGDAGAGVVSGTSQGSGYVRFLTGQSNVKVNGVPVVRHDSQCLINCNAAGVGGAPGRLVTEFSGVQSEPPPEGPETPSPELQALLDKEADERSIWRRTGDFFSGAWDATRRVASATVDSPGQAGIGLLKGIGNLPTDLWNLGMLGSKYTPVGGVIPSVAMRAGWLEDAAVQAYREGNTALANQLAGRASTMMSSGYVDDLFELSNDAQTGGSFLSMLIPVGAVVKGAGTAGRVGRAANAADNAADAARAAGAADTAADAARAASAGDTAADAARGSSTATDAAGVGDAATGAGRAERAAETGVHVARFSRAEKYAELVNSNKRWSWRNDFPGGESLTRAEKEAIKREAIARGLIPDIPFKPGTRFPDFEKAGLISRVDVLPESLWRSSDSVQFRWLNSRIPGGPSQGFTWHHSEIPGRMELVPFGPHNIITHNGGRSPGMWAHGNR